MMFNPIFCTCGSSIDFDWHEWQAKNGKHLLRAIIQAEKINSEAQIQSLSRNCYQFADLERIAGLQVSPEHVERHRESNPVPPDCE